jgi:uncharacterized protein YegP (UPF0339 family)
MQNSESRSSMAAGFSAAADANIRSQQRTMNKEATVNRFEAFRDMHDRWRWRLIGRAGRVIASSTEAFDSRVDAVRAAEAVKNEATGAPISDLPGIGPKEVIAGLIRREEARRLKVSAEKDRRADRSRPAAARRTRMGTSPARIRAVGSRRSA